MIPEKEKCEGVWPLRKCYTIPKIDFGQGSSPGQEAFPEGGLKMKLKIDAKDLEQHDTIVLYAVSFDIASVPEQERDIDDTNEITKVEDYSTQNSAALQPTFE